jgi:uncharacterized protein YybS (DUF2232 family)
MVLLVIFGALDFMIMFLIKKNVKWTIIITAGIIYFAVIFFAMFYTVKHATGQDVTTYITSELNNSLDKVAAEQKKQGASEQEIQGTRQVYDMIFIKPFPAWSIISVLFIVFLNYMVVRLFAYRKYNITNDMKTFELWYLNEAVVWVFIVSVAIIIAKKYIPGPWIYDAAYNSLFVLFNLYFFVGMAILSFLLKKFKVPSIIQLMAYGVVIFINQFAIVIILAGLLDTWFNFRKIEKGGSIWK